MSLIIGGAIGNIIDRLFSGNGVTDFIEFAFVDFPIFNVADICVTVGAVMMFIYLVFIDKTFFMTKDSKKEKEEARLQGEITSQKAATVLTVVLALIVIIFVLYIYNTNKKQAKQKATMAEQLHAQELSHRDIQICTMRNFLLKKIDIMEKIESMRNETEKHILISEDDWNEIEVFLDSVENLFVSRLRAQFSGLTKKDLRLMMMLRLKMPQKALALIYGISEKAIKQKLFLYKAKVGIEKEQKSLREFMENY